MQKGIRDNLWVVVLGVCALRAVASAQGGADGVWDPAEHFTPFWDSVELENRIENPARNPQADPNGRRQLAIRAGVELIDYENLIGIDRRERNIVVQDRDGVEIYRADNTGISRSYRAPEGILPRIGIGEWADEFSFSLSVPLDPNQGYPRSIGRLEWSTNLIIGETFMTVDIPFEPNETWIEVVPGLEVLVEEATVTEGRYAYRIKAIYEPNLVSYGATGHWHFRGDERLPDSLMLEMDMLNADGESVFDLSSGGGYSSGSSAHGIEGGLMEANSHGTGRCDACGDVTTIRYTFAVNPYELVAPFVLEDIPVPGF
ncbi:MAG: hypothetical protein JSW27_17045 [Phycisphaerales bacterium]|nr:MAG: hypothetical protein JSW27_17045 [Phycisphaerales bacterium]